MSDWKELYFRFLNKPRRSEMRVEEARLIKEQNLPLSLYKYTSFSGVASKQEADALGKDVVGQSWTLINLNDGVVSLRPPSTFNDPYDSCLSFSETALLNDLIAKSGRKPLEGSPLADLPDARKLPALPPPENALEELLQAGWKKAPEEFGPYPQFKRIMDEVFNGTNEQAGRTFNAGARKALRVSCFSERKDSLRMWSHYADSHKGICIEYEPRFLSFPGGIGLLHPVNYHPEHFDATEYFRCYPEDYNTWMLWIAACHKSPEWADEREWRYIDISFRDRYPIRAKTIILGVDINDDSRAKVTEIAHKYRIPLLKASLEPHKFRLKFGPA
jgi:hypothetical protein